MWELDHKERWAPKNWCFWSAVLQKTLESLLDCKEIQPVHPKGNQLNIHWKDWCWSWKSNTLATWCEELTHLKRPWCWERLKAGGEGDDRGWDGWTASLPQWTWVWTSSGSWWWTGKPGVLQSMGLQSQTQLSDWTELNWRPPQYSEILSILKVSTMYKLLSTSPPKRVCPFIRAPSFGVFPILENSFSKVKTCLRVFSPYMTPLPILCLY